MELSIIIVNWNSKAYVAACLRSLEVHAADIQKEVIVIDSGSLDGCGEMIARDFPWVHFIQSTENLGFPRANNVAADQATGRYVLLLNPDTEVHAGALQALLQEIKRIPDAGIIGARLLNTDGSLQTSCIQAFPSVIGELFNAEVFRRRFPLAPIWGMSALYAKPQMTAKVEMIIGACMLMTRTLFEKVGRFSSDYFMYVEDVDLCRKVCEAGYSNYYVPTAIITHHGGGSSRQVSGFSARMRSESLERYFRKWNGSLSGWSFRMGQGGAAVFRLALLAVAERTRRNSSELAKTKAAVVKWKAVASWAFYKQVSNP